MRRLLTALAVTFVAAASPVHAQDRAWPQRFWFSVGGGFQPATNNFDDTFELPLHQETERVTVDYPVRGGALIAANAGYRIWKGFTAGIGVTRFSRRSNALVKARLPHPFFDNQFREIQGDASTLRGETGMHLLLGWTMPVTDRIRLILTAGPSVLNLEQTLVTGVVFAETYPYDTASYSGADTKRGARSATGFNAGADVLWMFSRRVGAGGLVQLTRARVRQDAGAGRSISVDGGGAQAALGIRFLY